MKKSTRYRLVRTRDGLTQESDRIGWAGWKEDGTFQELHTEIGVGRSLVLGVPVEGLYTWMTTPVQKVEVDRDEYKRFRTTNSEYELYRELEGEGRDYL